MDFKTVLIYFYIYDLFTIYIQYRPKFRTDLIIL